MVFRLLACLIAVQWGGAVSATTITFKDIPDFSATELFYDEAGFRIESPVSDFGGFGGEHLHVDIAGGPYSRDFRLTSLTSSRFSLFSLDLLQYLNTVHDSGQPILRFTGFLGGSIVGTLTKLVGTANETLFFGAAFRNIDTLLIAGDCDPGPLDYCGQLSDVHFNIDNIKVSNVPLPAGGVLLFSALAGAMGLRRLARRVL